MTTEVVVAESDRLPALMSDWSRKPSVDPLRWGMLIRRHNLRGWTMWLVLVTHLHLAPGWVSVQAGNTEDPPLESSYSHTNKVQVRFMLSSPSKSAHHAR